MNWKVYLKMRILLLTVIVFFFSIGGRAQKVPQHVNTWYQFWGVSHDSVDQMMDHAPLAPYDLVRQRWYDATDSAMHWYTSSKTNRNTNTTFPQSLSYGRSLTHSDSVLLLNDIVLHFKGGLILQDTGKVRGPLYSGDSIVSYGTEQQAVYFGYSITAGSPGPPAVEIRYSKQVSNAIGAVEHNLAISSTTLVQMSAGDSSMQNRFADVPAYNDSYKLLSFEYTVTDALLNTDTGRYSRVWDSTLNTISILSKGWPPSKILVCAGTICGFNSAGISPGWTREQLYAGIAAREGAKYGCKVFNGFLYQMINGGFNNLQFDSLHTNQEGHNTYTRGILSVIDSVNFIQANNLAIYNRLFAQFGDFFNVTATNQVHTQDIAVDGSYVTHANLAQGATIVGDATGSAYEWNLFNALNEIYGFGLGPKQTISSSTLDIYYPDNNLGARIGSVSTDGLFTFVPKVTIGNHITINDNSVIPVQLVLQPGDSLTLTHSSGPGTQDIYKTPVSAIKGIVYRPVISDGGTTATLNNLYVIIDPSGAIGSQIIDLPSSPNDGDEVEFKFTQTVTTVTWSNGTIQSPPTSNVIGYYKFRYLAATSTWY